MLTIELNMYHAVALGAFLFWTGGIITDKVRLLNRYCIPAPLVGGLCFSILNCILYSAGIASITFDGTLQTVFMILFFTTVGFTVSIPALLKGGKAVMLCLDRLHRDDPAAKLPRRRGDGGVRLRSAAGHRLRLHRPHRRSRYSGGLWAGP